MVFGKKKDDGKKENDTERTELLVEPSFDPVPPGKLTVFGGGKYVVPLDQKTPPLLHLRAKFWTSFSGDSYQVKDVSVNPPKTLFEVGGKALSLRDKRVIVDAETKEPVFVMTEKIIAWLDDTQTILDADGNEVLFKVESNVGNTKQKTKGLKNEKGEEVLLEARVTYLTMEGSIYLGEAPSKKKNRAGGQCIATLRSPMQLQNFADDMRRDDYFVQVAPGVDMALILAFVLAYEKMAQNYKM